MSVEGLEHYSKDQLVGELINRQTFVGVVIYHRDDAKAGRTVSGEIVVTKSPPLTREGVETLLQLGQSLVPGMFGPTSPAGAAELAEAFPLHSDAPPLRVDEGGAVRVGSSRIGFDLIVEQYESGVLPEDMVRAYDTLTLADVYASIAYYLRHRDDVREYLTRRAEQAEDLRLKLEAERPRVARDEILERRTAREKGHAPTGQ